jgi:hypothetical protein
MIGLLINAVSLAILIWGFFSPESASWVFIGVFILVFEGHSLLMYLTHRSKTNIETESPPHYFSSNEAATIKKYPVLFKLPFAAMEYSSGLAAIPLASYVWVPWLLYSGCYIQAAVITANFFAVGHLVIRIDPRNFFKQAIQQGNPPEWVVDEIQSYESIMNKLHG